MTRGAFAIFLGCLSGCDRRVPEPPAGSVASATPLAMGWEVPASWSRLAGDGRGSGEYELPAAGGDVGRPRCNIQRVHERWDKASENWRQMFDASARSAVLPVALPAGWTGHMIELQGTRKTPLGPRGAGKRAPVEVIKEDQVLLGVWIEHPLRGRWAIELSGPPDSVRAGQDGLLRTVRSMTAAPAAETTAPAAK